MDWQQALKYKFSGMYSDVCNLKVLSKLIIS